MKEDMKNALDWLNEIISNPEGWQMFYSDSEQKICAEAVLAMLKEHEPVRVGKRIKAGDAVLDFYECGHCKNAIRKPWRSCPFCGRSVKWK